jgi:hypothetical protein
MEEPVLTVLITLEPKMETKCVLLTHASHMRLLLSMELVLDAPQTLHQVPIKEAAFNIFLIAVIDRDLVLTKLLALTALHILELNMTTLFVMLMPAIQIKLFQS